MRYALFLMALLAAVTAHAEESATESLCETGQNQSPISIVKAVKADLPEFEADYKDVELTYERRPNLLALDYPEGSILKWGEKTYSLRKVVFHTPAEHLVNGRKFDLEVQLEHKAEDGELLNVSIMMKRGFSNPGLDPFLANIPRADSEEPVIVEGQFFSPQIFIPANTDYYLYEGSETLPPCTEGVKWLILKSYVELGGEQLNILKKALGENARAIQPTGERVIQQK